MASRGLSFERRQRLYERLEHRLDAAGPEALAEVETLRRYEATPSTPGAGALADVARASIARHARALNAPLRFDGFDDDTLCCSWIVRCGERTTTIDARQSPRAFAAAVRAFAVETAARVIPIAVEQAGAADVPVAGSAA